MTWIIVGLIVFPIPFLFFCAWVSDKVCTGAGASIPGALIGMATWVVCWGMAAGAIIAQLLN